MINVITFTGLGEGVDLVTHGTGSVTDTAVRTVGVDTALRGETDPCLFTLVYICVQSQNEDNLVLSHKNVCMCYEVTKITFLPKYGNNLKINYA